MLLNEIDAHPELFGITRQTCEENESLVVFCENLLERRDEGAGFRILKLDEYYSTARMHNPPPAPDCLIIIEDEGGYRVIVVELKDVRRPKYLKPLDKLEQKFQTAVDFLTSEFRDTFDAGRHGFIEFRCWLVLAGFGGNGTNTNFDRRIAGTLIDGLTSVKPLRFGALASAIVPKSTATRIC